jgi:hypothetical protein
MYAGTSITSPGGLYAAEILVGGTPQPTYTAPDGYRYFAGEPGQAVQVRVRSLAGQIEAALAVDGRDALEDQAADLSRSRGLVFTGEYTFRGFRVSDHSTREFVLGSVSGSVADQAGAPANVGVIGLAAWRERKHAVTYMTPTYDSHTYGGSAVTRGIAPVAVASAGPSLGMHAGEARHDPVGRTTFEREGSPDVLEIGYDTLAALQAMGITGRRPSAFPGRETGYGAYLP